jgi:hypothetical protein
MQKALMGKIQLWTRLSSRCGFRPHLARQNRKDELGMVPALVSIACLTNPRVRFGRSPDELNIWAPFRFYPCGFP